MHSPPQTMDQGPWSTPRAVHHRRKRDAQKRDVGCWCLNAEHEALYDVSCVSRVHIPQVLPRLETATANLLRVLLEARSLRLQPYQNVIIRLACVSVMHAPRE